MRSRRITSLALSTLAATGGLAAVQPGAAHAASGTGAVTPAFNANELAFQGTGDYIARSNSYDYASLRLQTYTNNGQPAAVDVSIIDPIHDWTLRLGGQPLAVGTYTGTTTSPAPTGVVKLSGDGRGCDRDYGNFTIYQITTDATGNVTSLNASFTHWCDWLTVGPTVGFVHYNATPVTAWSPTTPALTTTPTGLHAHAAVTGFESLPADAQPASLFDFGDSTIPPDGSAGMTADHNYTSAGTYPVTATEYVADGSGLQSWTQTTPVTTVTPPPLTATLKTTVGKFDPSTGEALVTLDASGTIGDGVSGYSFDFGDGAGAQTSATPVVSKLEKVGSYNVSVTVNDKWYQTSVARQYAAVNSDPLVVSLKPSVGNVDPASGLDVVTLDASASTGDGLSYSFDFGDRTGSTPASSSPVATRPLVEGTYAVKVTVTDPYGHSGTVTQWVTVGDGYHPVAPQRLLDTRSGLGVTGGAAGKVQAVTLTLPDSVVNNPNGPLTAVTLNVTVTDTTTSGNVKVYPHGVTAPKTSNLNFTPGLTVANLVTVPVIDGQVQMDVTSPTPVSLVADISGYYTAGQSGAGFAPLTPTRLMDTRSGLGGVGGRVKGYGKVSLPVPASVSPDATAVVLNVTAVNTAAAGDLDVYPDVPGQAAPVISNLNFGPGAVVPNLVIVPISADRKIDFYLHSSGSADLLADIQGYFSPTATAKFVPSYPVRIFDTRDGKLGGKVDSGGWISVNYGEGLQVPNSALTAGLYNVTVTNPTGPGHITVYPDGLSHVPTVSNLNYVKNQTVPNAVLAPMTDGIQDYYNLGAPTDLIVDFFGYFAKPLATDPPTPIPNAAAKTPNATGSGGTGRFTTAQNSLNGKLAILTRAQF